MVTRVYGTALSAIASAALAVPLAASAADIRVMCYQDGIECTVTAELAKKFEAANPGTKVILDVVPYKTVVEQLPVQLAAGQGPDIARVTDLGGLSKYYLDISAHVKDRAYWESNFGSTLPWLRPSATDKGIYGFMSQLTMTGPYVNKTLFDQAKVPMPGPKATWDEWVEAARKVSKATQTPAALAWDRSGHRFAGPAISYGAKIFDAKGELVLDDGYKTAVTKFVGWHKDGAMLKEVWGGSGGSTYADSINEFKNGRVAMVLSGSWQINRLQKDIGNAFDWVAVPNPCGPAACTGIPGGAAWVALKTSKSPKEVGMFRTSWRRKPTMPSSLPRPRTSRPTPAWPRRASTTPRPHRLRVRRWAPSAAASPISPRRPTSSRATDTTGPSCCPRSRVSHRPSWAR